MNKPESRLHPHTAFSAQDAISLSSKQNTWYSKKTVSMVL